MLSTTHLHPMIVHFPIALILVGFLADLAYLFYSKEECLSKAGFYLMILGTLGAAAAFITGHLFTTEPTQGEIVKVFEQHETAALITLLIMVVASAVRIYAVITKKEHSAYKWTIFGLYLIGTIEVSITGFMGGNMVFNYMMGI
jgi:uncharacterized membrane protein